MSHTFITDFADADTGSGTIIVFDGINPLDTIVDLLVTLLSVSGSNITEYHVGAPNQKSGDTN